MSTNQPTEQSIYTGMNTDNTEEKMDTRNPTAPATPRTDAQPLVKIYDRAGMPYDSELVSPDFARTLERELSSAQAALAAAKREATAQGEHAVAMTELAQSWKREAETAQHERDTRDAGGIITEDMEHLLDENDKLRARVAELQRLLGEVYRNTNLRHHPELTGLADIVSKQLST